MDLYLNGQQVDRVWVKVDLTRDCTDKHGKIAVSIYHSWGGAHMMTLTGTVRRFQVIDFMVPH